MTFSMASAVGLWRSIVALRASKIAMRHPSWDREGGFFTTEYSRHRGLVPISSKMANPVPLREGSTAKIRIGGMDAALGFNERESGRLHQERNSKGDSA
jgi:hypothetical protein